MIRHVLQSVLQLVFVLIVTGALVFAVVAFMMARFLLTPPRMTGGLALWTLKRLTPRDLNLGYEELSFNVRDEALGGRETLKIEAWWIAARDRACDRSVMIIHGYADSKIGGIAWAPTFHDMGWNVLAIDLRAHGESGGRHTTAGYFERHDLSQVIDQIRAMRPGQTRRLVLFGVSLGAAVAGGALELRQTGAGGASDVDAVIMDCPYRDYVSAAHTHARVMDMPGPWFQRSAVAIAKWLSGADFYACSPVAVIPRLRCPLMVIHGADDLFVDSADMDAVEAATRSRPPEFGPTVYWRVERTHHVLALASDPGVFRRRLEDFLASAAAGGAECNASEGTLVNESRSTTPVQEISP
jgi:pimeloyl-ACP methyl ester carboxylesterase